ncbi:hypothetical protein [Sorangium sp. So ce1153]|uniref:hypothetical protein n=1 Tax=Sorangium sp. So ce1153 TaxID=3133333 RepID=UPI003F63C1B1
MTPIALSRHRIPLAAFIALTSAGHLACGVATALAADAETIEFKRDSTSNTWTLAPAPGLPLSQAVELQIKVPTACKNVQATLKTASSEMTIHPANISVKALKEAVELTLAATCDGQKVGPTVYMFAQATPPPPNPQRDGHSCGLDSVRLSGPLLVCSQRTKQLESKRNAVTLRSALPGGIDEQAAQMAAELLQILAEIAVDRARARGFYIIRERIDNTLCRIDDQGVLIDPKAPPPKKILLRRSCALLATVQLNDIAAQSQALQAALVSDLLTFAAQAPLKVVIAAGDRSEALTTLAALVEMITASLEIHFHGGHLQATLPNPKLVIDQAIEMTWSLGKLDELTFKIAVQAARRCLVQTADQCDLSVHIETLLREDYKEQLESLKPRSSELARLRTRAAALAQIVVDAVSPASAGVSPRDRWRLTLEVAGWLAQAVVDKEFQGKPREQHERARAIFENVQRLLLAIVDEDLPTALSKGAALVSDVCTKSCEEVDQFKVTIRVVATIGAFAATYSGGGPPDKQLHEVRRKLIEDLVEQMTDRRGRDKDTIVSVGANASFLTTGVEAVRDAKGHLGSIKYMAPQLALPLGVAVDGGWSKSFGWHMMAYPIDIGQFASYSTSEGINTPRWDTMLVAGFQAGLTLGHQTPAVFALDVHYAPALFAQTSKTLLMDRPGGALRVGLSIGYYVPFLDFN